MENKKVLPELTLISTAVWASIAISGGIIAIFAHNWDDLPHSIRVILSFFPVIIGLAVFSYSFLNKYESKVWMEASSAFLMLMVGSSIGMVAQVYHMGGDFGRFLFYWMIFCIPIIYIGRSTVSAILYLTGITAWFMFEYVNHFNFFAFNASSPIDRMWYWILLLGFIPHFFIFVKRNTKSVRALAIGWALVFSFIFTGNLGFCSDRFFHYITFVTFMYALGKYYFNNGETLWRRPFQTYALFMTVYFLLIYSSKGLLHQAVYGDGYLTASGISAWTGAYLELGEKLFLYLNHILLFVFAVISMRIYNKLKDEKQYMNSLQFSFPFVMALALILEYFEWSLTARIVLNLFLFVYAAWYILHGLKHHIASIIAWGLFILTAQLLLRYFDAEMAFWLKGIIYIAIGAVVLLFNKYYTKQMNV